jgi:hypothetical protein
LFGVVDGGACRGACKSFPLFLEDWQDVQFGRKGDDVHPARVSAKYGWLIFYDAYYDRVGMLRD